MSFELRPATRQGEQGAIVPLSRGLVAFVDKRDLSLVNGKKWYALKVKHTFYAAANPPMVNRVKGKTILMHGLILGCKGVDHKDGNGLNNRRENLRPATKSQNAVNSKRREATSPYRGVVWDRHRQKWAAYIRVNGKSRNLGRYETEIEAANAYRQEAVKVYGEFVPQPKL